jgi:TAT (twin-arginine translocation) pathway signal sequence
VNASGMAQPPEGAASLDNASRRTFLKGAGLAGAAGLVGAAGLSPFLATTSARAAASGIILGCQAPKAWDGDGTAGWLSTVTAPSNNSGSHALGVRSYRDTEFNFDGSNGLAGWWDSGALGSTTGTAQGNPIFPGEAGSIPLVSIRPHPSLFNTTTDLDGKIKDMILDGANKAASGYFRGTPQLTVWHEAGHLYRGHAELNPGDSSTGVPTNGQSAHTARAMHTKMQKLVKDVNNAHPGLPNVEYGCIIYGDVNKMANDTDLQGPTNWVPTHTDGALDWYGIDLYYEGDGTGKDCTHPALSTYSLVSSHLNTFLQMAQNRVGSGATPKINICECNANASNDSARPGYFQNLAKWLYNNPGYRMLTFFPDPAGPHSVTWFYVANPNSSGATISALDTIQRNYGR